MNVFVLDLDHRERARMHCDVHVNKMLLEAVQILNTAVHVCGGDPFYEPTHADHPWCEWATVGDNWEWLYEHATALGAEFRQRNGKRHASYGKLKDGWPNQQAPDCIPDGKQTDFPICTGDFEPESSDPVEAYREYYVSEKVPQDWCSWSTEIPEWVFERQ